jgi:hypothetical protein
MYGGISCGGFGDGVMAAMLSAKNDPQRNEKVNQEVTSDRTPHTTTHHLSLEVTNNIITGKGLKRAGQTKVHRTNCE